MRATPSSRYDLRGCSDVRPGKKQGGVFVSFVGDVLLRFSCY